MGTGCHKLRYSGRLVEVRGPDTRVPLSTHQPTNLRQFAGEVVGLQPCFYSHKATDDEGLRVPGKEHGSFTVASLLAVRRLAIFHLNI